MIYTITLSPAIDYKFQIDKFEFDRTIYPTGVNIVAGGKGINVSIVLDNLNVKNEALLTVGGETKELFLNLLGNKINRKKVFETKNNVRINLKGHSSKKDLEINDRTKPFGDEVIELIQNYLRDNLIENDYVVFSGSPPTGLESSIFKKLLEKVKHKVHIIVDSRKEYIVPLLDLKPLLIKPNKQELEDFVGKRIDTFEEVKKAATEIYENGVENVLVSLDKDGSILLNHEGFHRLNGVKNIDIIDATGAGDSMVAGFLFSHTQKMKNEDMHKYSTASALATITTIGLAQKEDVERWFKKLNNNE